MKLCLMIEGQEGVSWADWRRLALLAETHDFDALYRSDHQLSLFEPTARSSLDAWTTIAGLASVTKRLRFGTLVSPVGFRHPSLLAKIVATADQISDGRVEVGIGAGWYALEHASFGFDFPDNATRASVLEEYLEVVTRLWTEDQVDFRGQFFELEGAVANPKPVQVPHPPVVMGGLARQRSAASAARWASEYNLYETSPEQVIPKLARLAAACEAIGRDPASLGLSINANILIGSDDRDLATRAARHLAYQVVDTDPLTHLRNQGADRLVGTPERVLDQMASYAAVGVTKMLLQVFPHDDYEAIEMIGQEVVPVAARL
jgi:F420-dependent oxidoreductase-like protein